MRCWNLSFNKKFVPEHDINLEPSIETFNRLDDSQINLERSKTKANHREGRRYAVLWEPTESSDKAIPVFLKEQKDKEQIKAAIENDDFVGRVIFGKRLQKVIDAMYIKNVEKHEEIIREGERGKYMYIVAEGKFSVAKEEKGIVATLYAGKVFGELAILYNERRQATVTAMTSGKLWVLDRIIYQRIVREFIIEEKKEKLNFLLECPILKTVHEDILKKVADLLQKEYFPSGKVILRQGDPADNFYIITAGSVAILKDNEGLKGYLYKGNCFGEIALLQDCPRQATVLAGETGTECLSLAKQHFINHFGDVEDISRVSIPKLSLLIPVSQEHKNKYSDLNLSKFRIIQTIGEGGFGRVELIQHKKDHSKIFALKCLKRTDMVRQKQTQQVMNEKKIQIACESPFLLKLFKTDKDKKFLYFWLEICLGGDIYKCLKRQKKDRFNEETAKFVAGCLLEGMNYLHDRGIVYRDIKPENLLIDRIGYVKLADFGFAKELEPGTKTSTFAGTPEYVAPEILASKEYNRAVDFWGFGILIFELLNGKTPFVSSDGSHTQLYKNIERGFHKVDIPLHFSEAVVNLLRSLIRRIPEERLGYQIRGHDKIRSHPWFDRFEWKKLKETNLSSPIKPILTSNVDTRYLNLITRKHTIPKVDKTSYFDDF